MNSFPTAFLSMLSAKYAEILFILTKQMLEEEQNEVMPISC